MPGYLKKLSRTEWNWTGAAVGNFQMCNPELFEDESKAPSLGYVYIMSNEAFPHLLKIGFTDRKPEVRAKELSSTGCPYPFVVKFSVICENPYQREQAIHAELADVRESNNREFFNISLDDAKRTVIEKCLSEDFIDAVSDYYELELQFTVQDLREELAEEKEISYQRGQTIERNAQEAQDEWIAIANERDEAKKFADDCLKGNLVFQERVNRANELARIVIKEHCRVLGVESLEADFFTKRMGLTGLRHELRAKAAAAKLADSPVSKVKRFITT